MFSRFMNLGFQGAGLGEFFCLSVLGALGFGLRLFLAAEVGFAQTVICP